MKTLLAWAVLGVSPILSFAAQPWMGIVMPSVNEAAAAFPQPPAEYRAINWAIWGGQQTREKILSDIEKSNANGAGVYMINNSRGLLPKYFTPEYLDLVKFVVQECKKRGMKVWIEGDAGYPDGFAGGMISKDYPEMGMQGIVADARYTVAAGQTLKIPLPPDTLGILVNPRTGGRGGGAGGAGGGFGGAGRGQGGGAARGQGAAGDPAAGPATNPAGGGGGGGRRGGGGRGAGGGGAGGAPAIPLASSILPVPTNGQFQWTAPGTGLWEITFVRHVFRSSPTRFTNREDGTADKDSLYSLIDYLNPEATQTYIKLIHAAYEKVVGDEFGKTILGFRSDEPDYTGFMPWTPKLLETFQQQKGYDLKPFIPQFFANEMSPEATRAKADYWDVWSGMFRDNFFKPLQEWAEARNMHYMTHLNHEELMLDLARGEDLIRNEGSFFRAMRYSGVPGIDNLNQIGPGIVADFPKLASSTSHLYGRPMCWTESGGGLGANGKFVTDYQLVRGINYLNIRGLTGAQGGGGRANAAPAAPLDPNAAAKAGWYASRASYLLTIGRPAAQVALYHPTDSMWLGDQDSDAVDVKLTTQLMEQQIDFDHIDHDAIASICTLDNGGLKNLSGQVYRAIIVPSCTVIQKDMLERLRAFATAGGKVIFVGRTPSMLTDKNFQNPQPVPDLSFATLESTPEITAKVIAALPKPDVKLDSASPAVKYIHRSLKDGEVYFFFNESDQPQPRTATLAGNGAVQVWDATAGTIQKMADPGKAGGAVAVPLTLAPYESKFIVIGPVPAGAK